MPRPQRLESFVSRQASGGRYVKPWLEVLEDRVVLSTGLVGDVVVFGDSFSDIGNVQAWDPSRVPGAPYYGGRFSNGPVYVEVLTEYLGEGPLAPAYTVAGGTSYAVAAASVVVDAPAGSLGALVPELSEQVGYYLLGNTPDGTDLFVFTGGTNDFLNDPYSDPAAVAAAMADTIETVINAGGEIFLVGNLQPLGEMPLFAHDAAGAAYASWWTAAYNTALDAELDALRHAHPWVTIVELDLQALGREALAEDNPYGFAGGEPWIDVLGNIAPGDPDQYVYADPVHLTGRMNQVIGIRAAAAVRTALGLDMVSVVNTSDVFDPLDGGLSLREALALANEMDGRQTIVFDLGGEPRTIVLVNGALPITDDVSVVGPGAGSLTIVAGYGGRIFDVGEGVSASITDLTVVNRGGQGGPIRGATEVTSLSSSAADGVETEDTADGAVDLIRSLTVSAGTAPENVGPASPAAPDLAYTSEGTGGSPTGAVANGSDQALDLAFSLLRTTTASDQVGEGGYLVDWTGPTPGAGLTRLRGSSARQAYPG